MLGDYQYRMIMAGAGNFNMIFGEIRRTVLIQKFFRIQSGTMEKTVFFCQFVRFLCGMIYQMEHFLKNGKGIGLRKSPQHLPIQSPDRFKACSVFCTGILFKFHKQIIQERTFPAPGRAVKNIYLVLLCPAPQCFNMADQSVGKKSVSKKRMIRTFNKKLVAIVIDKINGLRVIRVLFNPFRDIRLDHIMKDLKNIAYHGGGLLSEQFQKVLKGNECVLVLLTYAMLKVLHCVFDIFHGVIQSLWRPQY